MNDEKVDYGEVIIDGRLISASWWGQMWCKNIENYSNLKNRLERGRTYIRKNTIKSFSISDNKIEASVQGTMKNPYEVSIMVKSISTMNYNNILDTFEKTDGFIKTKENGKCCIPIGESNVLDRAEILMYNLLMLLNIILPNGLTLLKNSRVETLMKKFDMNEIYLPKITMSGLTLDKVNFIRANLKQADLKDTTLEGAHLEGAHLEGAYLEKADLEWTHLERADLEWTHLERADLRKAHLERADLKGADLRAANLEKANLEEADLKGADLGRAHLEGAHLENAHLGEANLGETDLQYAHLKRADLEEVYLVGAHLRGVHLENANLIKADFDPIILKYAILENTKISKNKFDGIATLGIDVNKIIWCD